MFPSLYHAQYTRYSEDLSFWLELAGQYGGPILELGCGTGRVLSHLSQAGELLIGLDHDPEMLKFLIRTLPATTQPHPHVIQGDLSAFHLGIQFALIIIPCNTYTMLSAQQRVMALERVYFNLIPDGVFAASMPNPLALRNLPRRTDFEVEEVFPHPVDGEPVQVSSAWVRSKTKVDITWVYDHLHPDGSVQRLSHMITQYILSIETIVREFQDAGLSLVDVFGDFDRSPLVEDSTHLVLVSQKRERGKF